MTRLARLALACAAVALAASPACRGRGAGRHDCSPPAAPDGAPSLRGPSAIVGGADEAWAAGGRPVDEAYRAPSCCIGTAAPAGRRRRRRSTACVDLNELSALSARGNDLWLAAADRGISEGTVALRAPMAASHDRGRPAGPPHGDGRVFRRRGDAWEEAWPPAPDAGPPIPAGATPRVRWALAAAGPGEALDARRELQRRLRGFRRARSEGDVRLERWDGRALITVEIDRWAHRQADAHPVRGEGRAWPWSDTVRVLWVAGTERRGSLGRAQLERVPVSSSPMSPTSSPAAGPPTDRHLGSGPGTGTASAGRWRSVVPPRPHRRGRARARVPVGRRRAWRSHVCARLDGRGVPHEWRPPDHYWARSRTVRGLAGLAVGAHGAPGCGRRTMPQPPILRWRAGRWEVSPAARSWPEAGMTAPPVVCQKSDLHLTRRFDYRS